MGIYLTVAALYALFFWALNSAMEKPMRWPNVLLGALLWPLSVTLMTIMGLLVVVGLNSKAIDIVNKADKG
ncbi:hypothetical protein HYP06_gp059 [Vibrio phage vB_VspP_pVa5]|uniref:Uncharacterized protein n=1 Tax=Vibrio phage vB_VspP_pVa5 TaxID=1913109 RepID=A0A1J0GVA4_9CAUD|nr:hypothetical protein HYP06_gp059 [Vibrio phage vB_VspP_pVa5]APC46108.1 hypothetical protein vBVspPpVa5_0059 [Vibrio phage vB_VspP_pVa5]